MKESGHPTTCCATRPARQRSRLIALALVLQLQLGSMAGAQGKPASQIDLYVDEVTGQVFTKPAPGRTHLGTFKRVEGQAGAAPPAPARAGAAPQRRSPAPVPTQAKPHEQAKPPPAETPQKAEVDKGVHTATLDKALASKWYEKVSLRGYVQTRYTALLANESEAEWFHPADRSVREGAGFYLRRARLILSGDVSDHVYVYIQPDMNALPSDGDFSVQLRDAYADISIDRKKEFRFRVGQSKVPFGFVNLQSSQNRIPLERAEAFNYAAEGERDVGVFFYWAPAAIRARFRELVSSGLKGSGDYGVVGLGVYNGQGLNRLDVNNNVHVVGRVTYPFKFKNGQYFEPGIQAYWGRFLPRLTEIGDPPMEPSVRDDGVTDRRVGVSAVLYPQPFGLETEWLVGDGPELVDNDRIESEFLWGGYVQAYYQYRSPWGVMFPFVRWQYYDGGRKFGRDAPPVRLNEWDFGVEYAPWPQLELTVDYAFTPFRTNSSEYPYLEIKDGSRIGIQVQFNY